MIMVLLAVTGAGLLGLLTIILGCEIVAGFLFRRRCHGETAKKYRPSLAVVVPAHNEGRNVISTLHDLKAQIQVSDRLIVVADNCSDDTASVAAEVGAEVIERIDSLKIGKGYALDWAIQYLLNCPPDVVMIVDADCRIGENAVAELLDACLTTGRPAQALYLMKAPADSKISYQVAEFAWLTKNLIRPLGLFALGLPCQLMGTGMAFPWQVITSAKLASNEIVEDLKLGLDLALAGVPPVFCPTAKVYSVFPSSKTGRRDQRERWEKGHIASIVSSVPRLLLRSVVCGNFSLFVLTLDVAIPPLSLFSLLLLGSLLLSGITAFAYGSYVALFISIANAIGFGLAIFLCWITFGRNALPTQMLLKIPFYIISKLPLYKSIFTGKAKGGWIRTDRE